MKETLVQQMGGKLMKDASAVNMQNAQAVFAS